MTQPAPSFTVGIEEEYLLVHQGSGELVTDTPDGFMADCEARIGSRVTPEFLRCQVEVGTSKCVNIQEAAEEIRDLRKGVAEVASKYELAPIAASTHPFASWDLQKHTHKERYDVIARQMGGVARRMLICGMHVHIGIDDDELRIDLLGQVAYFLPHLLVLSTSSPFWRGEDSGLKSYRLAVFDELPRTGLPEMFDSYGEYERHVEIMVNAGLVEDASKIWWDVRPSVRFPTLEMRVPDICTYWRDGIAIAAIYQCLLRMLYRLKRNNQRWRRYANLLVQENRWRAQRYGMDEGLVDFGKGLIVPYKDLLEEILELIEPDAEALGCKDEVLHARTIIERGTSAHHQIEIYKKAREKGADKDEALRAVVAFLIEETVRDL